MRALPYYLLAQKRVVTPGAPSNSADSFFVRAYVRKKIIRDVAFSSFVFVIVFLFWWVAARIIDRVIFFFCFVFVLFLFFVRGFARVVCEVAAGSQ